MIIKKANLSRVLKNINFTKNEPVSIVHFLTNRCNARCSFCFIDFNNPNTFKNELTLNEINKLTKSMGKSLLNVNLTGGEPFARKDITDIARSYIKNTTVQSIYVTTNGSLPNRIENFAKEITNYKNDIELTFQISIDDLPEKHNKVRKIENLFENCIESYFRLKKLTPNISPVVSITVNHENCDDIKNIFYYLVNTCKIDSLKCTIVRDEGIYKTPIDKKFKIFEAYSWLTKKILEMIKNKKIKNYNLNSIQGKLHNKKDEISWELVKKMYLKPHYISPCYAGGLFGIITASGSIYPCEILKYKLMGNLRENNMDFMKIWNNKKTKDAKNFIKKTNCNCTYECALTYSILGNWRYQLRLISSVFNSY
jgi:MoaA/NifB/PqqE/SkfB family radical SAM enzyme|tara:strand:- start:800 stop:1903 length:1104 start_codon:yes stop_codon:yes gene_type:complete